MFNLTKADIAACGRVIGMTIRWNSELGEFQVFPKGTSKDHPSAYFTNDGEDALVTALAMVAGQDIGKPRKLTMTEESEASEFEFVSVEDDHIWHPTGDRVEAIGDNVYRIVRTYDYVEGEKFTYFYSLRQAMEAL